MASTALGFAEAAGRALSQWPRLLFFFAVAVGCRSPTSVVEPGAVLLDVKCAPSIPLPDELRVWVWDDGSKIWDNVRVPSDGSLTKGKGQDLGTILIQPNSTDGSLHVHIRGLARSVRVGDGSVRIDSMVDGPRVLEILLDGPAIDDCPFVPKPDQAACSPDNPADAASTGGASGVGGTGGVSGTGGVTNAAGASVAGRGGAVNTGGVTPTGGATAATGGAMVMGGAGSGGAVSSGGTTSRGADGGLDGRTASGGAVASGGVTASGGVNSSGGAKGSGGSTGKATSPPAITLPGAACTTETADANCRPAGVYCYKYCGPESQGYKILSCASGKYVEGLCTFSSTVDYACYALTSVAPCAVTPPTSGASCSMADCRVCGSGTGTGYYDGTKTAKVGYCVCSNGKWSCSSIGAWPCPGRAGC